VQGQALTISVVSLTSEEIINVIWYKDSAQIVPITPTDESVAEYQISTVTFIIFIAHCLDFPKTKGFPKS